MTERGATADAGSSSFAGKYAVVTGGSQGLGAATQEVARTIAFAASDESA